MDSEWGVEVEPLLSQMAEGTSDILWVFSRDWEELVFVNGAYESVYGRSVEALRADAMDFLNGVHPDDREEVGAAMDRLSNGETIELEYRVNADEEYGRWVWVKGWPVYDGDSVVRVVGFSRDVTDRKRQERELHRQNERLDEFASVVAHDLRNPLGIARGRLSLAQDECNSEHLEPAFEALDRMADIVDATLTLTRYGKAVVDPNLVPISDVAEKCWGMVDTGDAELELLVEFDVVGDPEQLRHLFENLFRNSVEHGSTGSRPDADDSAEETSASRETSSHDSVEHGSDDGRGDGVTVRVGATDGGFFVEDDGPGIPESVRETVFEPGYTTGRGGTGLGLTIVKRITEAHGWDVAVIGGHDGGTRFEFTGVG